MKVIPAVDLMDGQVVRLYRGDPRRKTVYSSDPVCVAKRWESAGADMLHLVDLDAALGTGSNLNIIEEIAQKTSVPVQVAGGLRSEKIIERAASFAARVVIGTVAFTDRGMLLRAAQRCGFFRTVISVDHVDGIVVTHGWQESTKTPLLDAISEFVGAGFTEFLLTNVGRDGTMEGPDLRFLEKACGIPHANVIASGGISGVEDVYDVRTKNAFAVILGRALYEGRVSIEEATRAAH